ncbi:MAG: hypothetical protein Q7R45_07255 [Sulfuricaulis sp.]|nr:hypothetical protein [Sulfuricaulis sp.]
MTETDRTEDLARAMEQAKAQYESIVEMVKALKATTEEEDGRDNDVAREAAEQAIQEDPLSVQVRSGWYSPGAAKDDIARRPAEYEILLCTGGPAARIVGKLNDYDEPETAEIECQDWFTPWTRWNSGDVESAERILLAYARCFYFGEG